MKIFEIIAEAEWSAWANPNKRKPLPTGSRHWKHKKHVPTSANDMDLTKSEPKLGVVSKTEFSNYLRQDDEFRKLDDFISDAKKRKTGVGVSKASGLRAHRRAYLLKELPFGPIREASRLNYGKKFRSPHNTTTPSVWAPAKAKVYPDPAEEYLRQINKPGHQHQPPKPGWNKLARPKKFLPTNPGEIEADSEPPADQAGLHPEDDDIYSVMKKKVREPGGPKIRQRSKHNTHHIRKTDYDG